MVKPPNDPRQQRLAVALRANLMRRKARDRGTTDPLSEQDGGGGSADPAHRPDPDDATP